MDIKLIIEAPQLSEAITKLAVALQGSGITSVANENQAPKEEKRTKKQNAPKVEDDPKEEPQTETIESGNEQEETDTTETDEAEVIDAKTVRAYLQKLSDAGRQKDAKNIITSMGYTKLSDIPEERRVEVIEKVKELLGDE